MVFCNRFVFEHSISPNSPHSHHHSPHSHPDYTHSHPYSLHSHPHSPHSTHSVRRFPIPAFTDSSNKHSISFGNTYIPSCSFHCVNIFYIKFRGCSYGGEPARLCGLAHLGERIFIPYSYGICYLSSTKSLLCRWKKIVWSSSFYNKQWRKAII